MYLNGCKRNRQQCINSHQISPSAILASNLKFLGSSSVSFKGVFLGIIAFAITAFKAVLKNFILNAIDLLGSFFRTAVEPVEVVGCTLR